MSAFPSNYYITQIFNLITGSTPYLALYTSNPTAADSGTEVSGGGYSRKSVTFSSITVGAISNTNTISFTNIPTANITHWGIRDASTGGNLKVFGALNSSVATISGDEVSFPVGNLQINLTGS